MIEVAAAITTIGDLGLGRELRHRQRGRREAEADQDVDLLADQHLLHDAPG